MTEPRYRLSPHAFARKHVSGGRAAVALFDQRKPGVFYPGAKGWAVLQALDGSRDLDGVLTALSRQHAISRDELSSFVETAAAHGILVSEVAAAAPPVTPHAATSGAAATAEDRGAGERPVRALPNFELRCDGRGSCCRLYPSIVASPLEAANARSAMPSVLDAGDDEARAFFPERNIDRRSLSIALVDGACAYLDPGGGCGVHARRGAAAKPLGCRVYPLTYVDDGESIREVAVPECACVIESGLAPASSPLAPPSRAELDPRVIVDRAPARARVGAEPSIHAALHDIRGWCDRLGARALEAPPRDVAAHLFGLSCALRGGELLEEGALELDRPRIAACAAALEASARRRREELEPSGLSLANLVFQGIELACGIATDDLDAVLEVADDLAAVERFYLRNLFFGLDLVTARDDSLSDALFDRGFRVLVARAMTAAFALAGVTDPAVRYPIAVLHAAVRAYGLATSA
ncbi:MAG: YkgJ family cysteine cluster protein [Polyangiaceae bacterium]